MGMKFIFPIKQHIGEPAVTVVNVGDYVERGMLIANAPENQLGASIFTSISGIVTEIKAEQIIIEEDGTDFTTFKPLKGKSAGELIKKAGIVGLGGAGFPTYVKMNTKLTAGGAVIINGAECEPILSHNIARIEKEPEKLLRGLQITMDLLKVNRGIIALKKTHKNAFLVLKNADPENKYEIRELEDIYPAGEERSIIRDTMGILLEPEELPSKADMVILNAETVFRIREAVEEKKPFIDKDMTVGGKLNDNGAVKVLFDVPLGKPVGEVFRMVGGVNPAHGELIMGGSFTGKRTKETCPVVKTTGGLLAAECFPKEPNQIGLLVCACGADEKRLRELAGSMGSQVTGVEYCKQAVWKDSALKCQNPGHCPGQAEKVMSLKRKGARALLISCCSDCSNTVMSCAPKLKLPVYHCTDGALRSVNHKLIRSMK